MHTKYRNHQRLIKLAKHWAINIDSNPDAFIEYFQKNCNYENLLSDQTIKEEAQRVYNAIPKIEYGDPKDYPGFRVNVSICSGKNEDCYIHIYGKDLTSLKQNIDEFKADYKKSFFKVTKVNSNWLHKEYTWDFTTKDQSEQIKIFFKDILDKETDNYLKEEKKIKWLDKMDHLTEQLDFFNFRWATLYKVLSILYFFIGIYYLRNEKYWISAFFAFTFVFSILDHNKKVHQEKMMDFRKDLSKLGE
jgi:hypothetical protein